MAILGAAKAQQSHGRNSTQDGNGLDMSSTAGAKHVPIAVPVPAVDHRQAKHKQERDRRGQPRSEQQRDGPVNGAEYKKNML